MILSRYHALRDMTEEGIEVYAPSAYGEMAERLVERVYSTREIHDALDFGRTIDQHLPR